MKNPGNRTKEGEEAQPVVRALIMPARRPLKSRKTSSGVRETRATSSSSICHDLEQKRRQVIESLWSPTGGRGKISRRSGGERARGRDREGEKESGGGYRALGSFGGRIRVFAEIRNGGAIGRRIEEKRKMDDSERKRVRREGVRERERERERNSCALLEGVLELAGVGDDAGKLTGTYE
ncbi:hypothetical protein BHM03_00048232 [Ensete ventricosum]|nr:hypothetical protein BHM03_00048232 [Ensete ventricosum]